MQANPERHKQVHKDVPSSNKHRLHGNKDLLHAPNTGRKCVRGGNKPSRRHQRSFGSELGSLEVELKRFGGEGGKKANQEVFHEAPKQDGAQQMGVLAIKKHDYGIKWQRWERPVNGIRGGKMVGTFVFTQTKNPTILMCLDVSFDGGRMWLGPGPSGREDAETRESHIPKLAYPRHPITPLTVSIAAQTGAQRSPAAGRRRRVSQTGGMTSPLRRGRWGGGGVGGCFPSHPRLRTVSPLGASLSLLFRSS